MVWLPCDSDCLLTSQIACVTTSSSALHCGQKSCYFTKSYESDPSPQVVVEPDIVVRRFQFSQYPKGMGMAQKLSSQVAPRGVAYDGLCPPSICSSSVQEQFSQASSLMLFFKGTVSGKCCTLVNVLRSNQYPHAWRRHCTLLAKIVRKRDRWCMKNVNGYEK